MGVPQNGWFMIENPSEMDDLGGPRVWNPPDFWWIFYFRYFRFSHWFIHQKWGIYWEHVWWSIAHRSRFAGVALARCHAQAVRGASGAFWSWSFWSLRWDASWETLGTTCFGLVGLFGSWYRHWSIFLHLSIYLSIYPSIYPSIYLPT